MAVVVITISFAFSGLPIFWSVIIIIFSGKDKKGRKKKMTIFEPLSFLPPPSHSSLSTPHQQNGYEISGISKPLLTQDIPE